MRKRDKLLFGLTVGAATALGAATLAHRSETHKTSAADLKLPGYAQQKVVYHVTDTDSLTHRGYTMHVLQAAQNHVNAVGKDKLDLRIVLQGDGLDLLSEAKRDPNMSRRVDELKAEGVKFLICRNSLVSRNIDPTELYGVNNDDIVGAAVAEVASLQAQGFVYLKP